MSENRARRASKKNDAAAKKSLDKLEAVSRLQIIETATATHRRSGGESLPLDP
jgi:hypothetical protein